MLVAIVSGKKFPSQKELSRKIVHIGTGPAIPIAWWFQIPQEVALIFAGTITISLLANLQWGLLKTFEDIKRRSYGTVAYALSITILIYFFWTKQPAPMIAGILVMAFGDGFAGLLGSRIKSFKWKVSGQEKSIVGTLTMFIISFVSLWMINFYSSYELNQIEILGISLLAVSLEQIGNLGIDNLTVPLGVAFSWSFLS